MNQNIDIDSEDLATVKQILNQNLPPSAEVWVFGSRAKGEAKSFSDLDLAIQAASNKNLPFENLLNLQADFRDSDLPWKVDVVDLNTVSPEFRHIIETFKIPLDTSS